MADNIYDMASNNLQQSGDIFTDLAAPPTIASSINDYLNPYRQEVLDNALGRMRDERDRSLVNVGDAAEAASAFGGSRHGLVEADLYDNFNRNAGELTSNVMHQGFNTAANYAGQDIANTMQGQSTAASGLAGLGGQQFGIGQAINQSQAQEGAQQQAMIQAIMDLAGGQFGDQMAHPQNMLNVVLSALSGSPLQGESTQTYTPGMFDYLSLIAQTGGQIGQGAFKPGA